VSQEVWSGMQGSVLVVKEELIRNHPEVVEKLVKISQKAADWINQHPQEAAEIVARQLQESGGSLFPVEIANVATRAKITPEVLLRSMNRLEYTTDIDLAVIQDTINYVARLGYIKSSFKAEHILDLSFIEP
jgi:NitT/TauT family transport system substrate-binding protein